MDLHLDEGLGSIPNRFALLVERYQKLLSVHICEHALPNPKPRCIFGLSTHRLCFACAQICLLRSLRDLRRALAFKCSVVSAPPSVTDEGPLPLILLPVPVAPLQAASRNSARNARALAPRLGERRSGASVAEDASAALLAVIELTFIPSEMQQET
eukprot:Tamp_17489.p1 GENE.Tamp_17489~~Tamp_17489.p1  ORF type:complete len:156 (-),score=3.27 Tamp_17489:445-912(-)